MLDPPSDQLQIENPTRDMHRIVHMWKIGGSKSFQGVGQEDMQALKPARVNSLRDRRWRIRIVPAGEKR